MAKVTYRCTLSAATFSDEIIPISSFQMRLRQSPSQCYLSVVVPTILDYADIIADRSDGEITITHIEGGTETDILADANTNAVRYYIGPTNRTGQIVAYKQITFPGTGTIAVNRPTYRALDDGTYRYRSSPIATLKPTDTADVAGWESVTVDEVTWNVNSSRTVIEFSGT